MSRQAAPALCDRTKRLVRSSLAGFLGLGLLAIAALATGQPPQKPFLVGYLSAAARTADGKPPAAFRESMKALGYVEGARIVYESRFAEGKFERLPALAAELVRLNVNVLVAQGGLAQLAAKEATSVVPIVMAPAAGDAVAAGLIRSLARPGGNVTGLTDESIQLSAKRMELLKLAVPNATRIAVLWNAMDQGMTLRYREIEKAAKVLNVEVHPLELRGPEDFAVAFSAMTRRRPDAMFLVADPLTVMNRKQIIAFAAAQRIPAMYEQGTLVREGGLMSYGPNLEDGLRTAATYLDRIFKGARPADLPAQQPTRYYLAVNLKTAGELGMTFPQSLLLRTDDTIE
jgi:putative tryptophan/tyrosine transport system substrate-binding protein